jgi:hypothetical protein
MFVGGSCKGAVGTARRCAIADAGGDGRTIGGGSIGSIGGASAAGVIGGMVTDSGSYCSCGVNTTVDFVAQPAANTAMKTASGTRRAVI